MFRFRSVVPALGVLAVTLVASAGTYQLKADAASSITFKAKATIGLGIPGKFSGLKVVDDGTTITLSVPANTVDTGIERRDIHAKKTLGVGKKGDTISVAVPKKELKVPADGKSDGAKVTAQVTINGQTKPVRLSYVATRTGSTYAVKGDLKLENVWANFGMEQPEMAGVTVKPEIELFTSFSIKEN